MAVKKTNGTSSDEVETITINIQPFLLPLAILLSAFIIFLGLANINSTLKQAYDLEDEKVAGSSDTTNDDNTGDTGTPPTVAGDTPAAVTAGKVNIDDDPVLGNKGKAKVAIVEFSDFECPFCKRHHQQTHDQIVSNFVDNDKAILVYRDFPLSFHEPMASKSANAAECVQDQKGDKAFFEFAKAVYNTTNGNGNGITDQQLKDLAKQAGVDEGKFSDCYDNNKFAEEVKKDTADGSAAGVSGTPGFIVGVLKDDGTVEGEVVSGAQPYSVFEAAINRQLEKAK